MDNSAEPTPAQWAEARRRASKRYGEGSIPYREVLKGNFDTGAVVRDVLTEVMIESIVSPGLNVAGTKISTSSKKAAS